MTQPFHSVQFVKDFFERHGLTCWTWVDKRGWMHTLSVHHPKRGILYQFKLPRNKPRISHTELVQAVKAMKG